MEEIKRNRLWLQLMAEGEAANAGTETGENDQAAAGGDAGAEAVDLDAEFEGLIKGDGKYREAYGKRVAQTVQQRTKGMRAAVDQLNGLRPALEVLAARYDLDINDPKLAQMIAEDKGLLEDKALRNNRDTDTELEIAKARAEANRAKSLIGQMLAERDAAKWQDQAKELEKANPGINVKAALDDPDFTALLQPPYNLDLKTAYMAKYGEQLISAAASRAAKQVTDKVAAGKSRPRENGTGAPAGAAAAVNPMNMSKEQYKEYCDAIMRGERVDFTAR